MADPIITGGLLRMAGALIDRLFPDKAARDEAKLKVLEMELQGELAVLAHESKLATGQMEINKAEAQSASTFVAGWRPSIGWICSGALLYQFILLPLLGWVALINGYEAPPPIDIGPLFTLLLGMLGLGGMRTYEKLHNVNQRHN